MKLRDYLPFVLSREGGQHHDLRFRLRHAGAGMISENGELMDIWKKFAVYGKDIDTVHLVEELGDFMWYVATGMNALGFDETSFKLHATIDGFPTSKDSKEVKLFTASASLSHISSKFIVIPDRREIRRSQQDMSNLLGSAIDHVIYIGRAFDVSLVTILEANVNKLRKRYPDKFEEGDALNRNLDEEKRAIETVMNGASA